MVFFRISPPRLGSKLGFDTLWPWRSQLKMSHTSREKLDLVSRTKRIVGQLESDLRGLNQDEHCADVLQRLAATSTTTCPGIPAAEDVIEIVKSYLK